MEISPHEGFDSHSQSTMDNHAALEERGSVHEPTQLPTISLHDSGDITLMVGTDPVQPVVVKIDFLRAASPVWYAMFNGSWAESTVTEIPHPDDDIEAMVLVLIIHHRVKNLPKKEDVSMNCVYQLSVLSDKYDIAHVVRPFLGFHKWGEDDIISPCDCEHPDKMLFYAWTFGHLDIFKEVAEHLAMTMISCDEKAGVIQTEDGRKVYKEHCPPGIFESITQVRNQTVKKQLDKAYGLINHVVRDPICIGSLPPSYDRNRCAWILVGSLIDYLAHGDLYQRPKPEDCAISVRHIFDMLKSGDIVTPFEEYDLTALLDHIGGRTWDKGYPYWQSDEGQIELRNNGIYRHTECAHEFKARLHHSGLDEVKRDMPSPVLDEHREHIKYQAAQ